VPCMVQLAAAVGSDVLWRPLNRDVLMATRHEAARTRLLALRVTKALVAHLRYVASSVIPPVRSAAPTRERVLTGSPSELYKLWSSEVS
jgi:hypothetical protein